MVFPGSSCTAGATLCDWLFTESLFQICSVASHRWAAIDPLSTSTSSYNTNYSSKYLIKQLFEEDFSQWCEAVAEF